MLVFGLYLKTFKEQTKLFFTTSPSRIPTPLTRSTSTKDQTYILFYNVFFAICFP